MIDGGGPVGVRAKPRAFGCPRIELSMIGTEDVRTATAHRQATVVANGGISSGGAPRAGSDELRAGRARRLAWTVAGNVTGSFRSPAKLLPDDVPKPSGIAGVEPTVRASKTRARSAMQRLIGGIPRNRPSQFIFGCPGVRYRRRSDRFIGSDNGNMILSKKRVKWCDVNYFCGQNRREVVCYDTKSTGLRELTAGSNKMVRIDKQP